MHQSRAPCRYRKHDPPSWCGDCPLRIAGYLDLIELGLDPVIVGSIVVQLPEYSQRFICTVCFDEVSRGLREEQYASNENHAWDALECKWETPREGIRNGHFRGAISYPGRDDKSYSNHLLRNSSDETYPF